MKKLDKKRPYAENFGELKNRVKYIQDGIEFDTKGVQVKPVLKMPSKKT